MGRIRARSPSVNAACHRKERHDDFQVAVTQARARAPKDGRIIYVYRCSAGGAVHYHLAHKRGPEVLVAVFPKVARRG